MGSTVQKEAFLLRYESPLGGILLSSDGKVLTRLRFVDAGDAPPRGAGESLPVFRETLRWLDLYFSGRVPDFLPPLASEDTPHRSAVRRLLLEIPYGRTVSYGELAGRLAALTHGKSSARAIGSTVGRNPIGLIVPCHRVIGANGALVGYADGLERKRWLLAWESGGGTAGQ